MDFTESIPTTHHEKRRRFAVLEEVDYRDVASLATVRSRLAALLEVPAKTEDKAFSPPDRLRNAMKSAKRCTSPAATP